MVRRLCQCLVLTCIAVLVSEDCLAYGGWKTNTFGGAVAEVLPFFLKGIAISLVPYVICSVIMDRIRLFYLPLFAYLIYVPLFVWRRLVVMGEPGPAHVAFDFTCYASVIFPVLLLAKFSVTAARRLAQEKHDQRVQKERTVR